MGTPLRALLVEDVETDAALLVRELERGGFEVTHQRVDTPEAMSAALAAERWDVVLADYTLPRFNAPHALRVLQERDLDLPFIIVSGTVNEDIAVESLRAGAHDFMAKSKLGRLIPAIERELRDVALRAEQRKLREQLLISERMASVGTVAAGVAHEINNPLACVLANLDLAERGLAERAGSLGLMVEFEEVREELRDAREAAERIRNMVRDLKLFSRIREEPTGPVDVTHVLESTLRIASNEIRHRARLVTSYGNTPPVQASESRLGQVFLNLVVNAAQAIGEGQVKDNEIRISTSVAPNNRVLIEIADTGSGMPPEVLARLFTPFFTTKPVGVGTGLGLSICHRIVTGFGGTIDVSSEVGKGTTFRLWLPTAASGGLDGASGGGANGGPSRGRVLVIDDEPMAVRVMQRILSPEHEVVAFGCAAKALDFITGGTRFDVILCDLMMPQMTGMEFYAALNRLDPAQAARIIFVTGGAFTPAARTFLDAVPNQRVEKPFDAQHLRALVNDRLK